MGSSARAKIAWAVDLGDPENTGEGFDWDAADINSYDFEDKIMPGLFGFIEEAPAAPTEWKDWGRDERVNWRETVRVPWGQRFSAAVPLKFEKYGYEMGGTALVLKRSLTSVEWGAGAVDPATLAEPTEVERAAFRTVLERPTA